MKADQRKRSFRQISASAEAKTLRRKMGTFTSLKKIIKPVIVRSKELYFHLTGNYVECNICHSKSSRFDSDKWHKHTRCPRCHSEVRQRLLVASLSLLDNFSFEKIIQGKKVLHFAPEKIITRLIQPKAAEYKTADFLAEGYSYDNIDYNIDISDMKMVEKERFDCVIACDVLEHVPDHLRGLQEVHRILKNGGFCIFTVPQKDNLKRTYEDSSITGKADREAAFGQIDHLRIYGDDFTDMMASCGFKVTAVDEHDFEKKVISKYVLAPPLLSSHPLATNYRKVFFGTKL